MLQKIPIVLSKMKRKRLPQRYRLQVIESIKRFIQKKDLTQKSIAAEMKFTGGNLSQVLTGSRDISVGMLIKLRELYGLSSDEILYGGPLQPKEFITRIEIVEQEKQMIEQTEGPQYIERFVPIPIAAGKISGGSPCEVREAPEGVALIYEPWARNREDFTAVWIKGQSMEPTISDGSLVGIDHSKKEIFELDGKIVAIRKDNEATIKRLRIVSKKLVLGLPDNPDFMKEAVSFTGEQINTAIIGKVAWWWGRQE